MHSNLKKLFNHPVVKQTHDKYNLIWENHQKFPYLNYFGINFNGKEITSFKIYYHVFHQLKEEEIMSFLPTTVDINKYYHLHEFSRDCSPEHTGLAFEIKFKGPDLTPVLGFHMKLKNTEQSYDLIGKPESLPFKNADFGTRPGINYEYSSNNTLRKRYYYFDREEHKAYFARRFGYPFLNNVKLIEFTEADNFSKINVWVPSGEHQAGMNRFSTWENRIIESLCSEYGLKNHVFGYYEKSSIRSIYFIVEKDNKPPGHIRNEANLYRDTLQCL